MKTVNNLTDAENQVRDTILKDPYCLLTINMKQLAKKANVGISTVNRFTQKLGYKGFKEFKIDFIKSIHEVEKSQVNAKQQPFHEDTQLDEILEELPLIYSRAIQFTTNALDKNVLKRTVENIQKRKVLVFGTGVARSLADCFVYKLEEVGIDARSFDHLHYQYVDSCLVRKEKMFAIVLTHSGRNIAMLHILKMLKNRKIPVLLITSLEASRSLIENCTDVLCTIPTKNTKELSNVQFILSIEYILDVIYCMLLTKNMELVIATAKERNYYKEGAETSEL